MGKLDGKTAVVTGGGRGIGRDISIALAKEGVSVVVSDIDEGSASGTSEDIIAAGGKAVAAVGDVSKSGDAKGIIDKSVEAFSSVDILINNAGITRDGLIIRMTDEDWDKVISVNLTGAFNMIKAAGRIMMKKRYGKIVSITSVVGIMGNAGQSNYAASKAGLIGLTRSAAKELASRNVCVNAVAPGYIETEMTRSLPVEAKEAFLNSIPLKRAGTPSDVANAVLFLSSPESDYITGQVIQVDGGMIMA